MKTPTTLAEFAACLREFIRAASSQPDSASAPAGPGAEAFEDLAQALFALQFAANEPFRRLCQARGVTPEKLQSWRDIPAMPTSAFKVLEVTCLQPSERRRLFQSSGTTGQVLSRHFHSADSLAVYEASVLAWFGRHLLAGLAAPVHMLILSPPADAVPHSSLVHMFETVSRHWGAADSKFYGWVDAQGAWRLDSDRLIADLEAVSRQGAPVLLMGTAFNWVHLLDALAARDLRLRLPPGSRLMETGGYKGRSRVLDRATLYRLMTDRLGVAVDHIVCEYGMTELSSQAYDHVAGQPLDTAGESTGTASPWVNRQFRFPPWARVQIISPETGREVTEGEPGLICVYDLANVWSVLGVQTEDLGICRANGFELLGRIAGSAPRGCSLLAEGGPEAKGNKRWTRPQPT